MTLADIWPTLPEDPTWLFVLCLALVIGYFLLRAYTANQQVQINGLRESLDKQADRHAEEMKEMRARIDRLDALTEEARTERHQLRSENTVLGYALFIIRDLYTKCTCGALNPVETVLRGLDARGEPS